MHVGVGPGSTCDGIVQKIQTRLVGTKKTIFIVHVLIYYVVNCLFFVPVSVNLPVT